jgi:hypothetical protein
MKVVSSGWFWVLLAGLPGGVLFVIEQRELSEVPVVSEERGIVVTPVRSDQDDPLHSVGQGMQPSVVFRVTGIKAPASAQGESAGIDLATSLIGLPTTSPPEVFGCDPPPGVPCAGSVGTFHELPVSETYVRREFINFDDLSPRLEINARFRVPGVVDPVIQHYALDLELNSPTFGFAPTPTNAASAIGGACHRYLGGYTSFAPGLQCPPFDDACDLSPAPPECAENCLLSTAESASAGWELCYTVEIECPGPTIACEVDLGAPCGVVAGTRTCTAAGIGQCESETFQVECEVDAGQPCGLVTGTQTCSSSGAGMCMPPGQEDCSMDFGPPCGELFGTLACDDPGAMCMVTPTEVPCTADLGEFCVDVAGTLTCDSSGVGECVPNGTTEVDCDVDLGPPCGVVQGTATCGPEGEGECVLPGNGTPETGYDTDNDCDRVLGECEAPQDSWTCMTSLTTAGCEMGTASCDENGAGPCVPPSQGVPELFDGEDNNCDGFIDECQLPQLFWPCATGNSTPGCDTGQLRCSSTGTTGTCHIPEIANGMDDDCDGDIDECDNDEFILSCDASGQPGCAGGCPVGC